MALWDYARIGRWEHAREIYRWFMPVLHLDSHPKLVQYTKLVYQELGFGDERVRPSRLPLIGEERARIMHIIRYAVETRPDLSAPAALAGA